MNIPSQLEKVINKSLKAVDSHPQHDLNLGYRQAIWTALDYSNNDNLISQNNSNNLGHQRRAFLANLTIAYVLPIWYQEFPHDNLPQYLLSEADKLTRGMVEKEIAEQDYNNFLSYMNQLGYTKSNMAFTVGYGAVQALGTALYDENFAPDDIDYEITDSQDSEGNDASFFAACAYANGPIWKAKSNSQKRREFWQWWLKTAVPQSYNIREI
jgi:hypothetical protein